MSEMKTVAATLSTLEAERSVVVGELVRLNAEFKAISFNAARGDAKARVRQDEIAPQVHHLNARLRDIDTSIAHGKTLVDSERAAETIAGEQRAYELIQRGLEKRLEIAEKLDILLVGVGALARQLKDIYAAAHRTVTFRMSLDEALMLGVGDEVIFQTIVGGILRAGNFDPQMINNLSPLGVSDLNRMPPAVQTVREQNETMLGWQSRRIANAEQATLEPLSEPDAA